VQARGDHPGTPATRGLPQGRSSHRTVAPRALDISGPLASVRAGRDRGVVAPSTRQDSGVNTGRPPNTRQDSLRR